MKKSYIYSEWPVYFKNILRVGNLESNVGVVTLWTERDVVEKAILKIYTRLSEIYMRGRHQPYFA